MIHGYKKFWNIIAVFLRRIFDAALFSVIFCLVGMFPAPNMKWDNELFFGVFAMASLLALLLTIIRAIKTAKPKNESNEIQVCDKRPDAINVKIITTTDINVKIDRGAKRVFKHIFFILMCGSAVAGGLLSAIPAMASLILLILAVLYNKFICKSLKRCKCPMCKQWKAIKFVSKELLEEKIKDWTESTEKMDTIINHYRVYRIGLFKDTYLRNEDVKTHKIRTHTTKYLNAKLGRFSKQYICRFCGQRFVYEDTAFEPAEDLHDEKWQKVAK